MSKNINKHGIDTFVDFLADLQVSGAPDQVFERMREYQDMTNFAGFNYGGMPHELAKTSMRTLFSMGWNSIDIIPNQLSINPA